MWASETWRQYRGCVHNWIQSPTQKDPFIVDFKIECPTNWGEINLRPRGHGLP